jgi:predicted nuclease with RNAse H fold
MNKKAEYLGNCIESFDENGISNIEIYDNTSDFALAEEDATVINLNKFIEITKLSTSDISHFITNDNIYLYDENTKSAFIYNDIEQF